MNVCSMCAVCVSRLLFAVPGPRGTVLVLTPPSVSAARPLEAGGAERTRQRQRICPQQLLIARCVTLTFITALNANTHKALPESEAHGDDKLSIMHVPSFSRTECSTTGLYGVHTLSGARA